MPLNQQEAVQLAVKDLSSRLMVGEGDIAVDSVQPAEFPNACLGAERVGEMCAEMLVNGWRIMLSTPSESYEYRGARNQLRLFNYKGQNFRVYP